MTSFQRRWPMIFLCGSGQWPVTSAAPSWCCQHCCFCCKHTHTHTHGTWGPVYRCAVVTIYGFQHWSKQLWSMLLSHLVIDIICRFLMRQMNTPNLQTHTWRASSPHQTTFIEIRLFLELWSVIKPPRCLLTASSPPNISSPWLWVSLQKLWQDNWKDFISFKGKN